MYKKFINRKISSGKIKLNVVSGLMFFFLNSFFSLFINPFLLNNLGASGFGLWKLINQYMGFISFADGKSSQALKWTIADKESYNNFSSKKRDVGAAIIVWLIMLPILVCSVAFISFYFPSLINENPHIEINLLRIIVGCMGLNMIFNSIFSIPEAVLIGTNNVYIPNLTKTIWYLVFLLFLYYTIIWGYSLMGLALSTIAVTIMRGANNLILCKSKVKWLGVEVPTKKELQTFFNFSSLKLIWSIIAKFLISGEVLLIGFFFGTISVSKYVFTSYIGIIGITIAGIITSSLTPNLGKISGSNNKNKLGESVFIFRKLLLAFNMCLTSIFLIFNNSFVSLWVGKDQFLGGLNNLLIALIVFQLIHIRSESALIDLSLNIKNKVVIGLLSTFTTIALSRLGIFFGYNEISIILVSTLIGRLIFNIVFPNYTNNNLSIDEHFKTSKNELVFLIGGLTLSWFLGNILKIDSWPWFIIVAILGSLLVVKLAYHQLLCPRSKTFIKQKIIN